MLIKIAPCGAGRRDQSQNTAEGAARAASACIQIRQISRSDGAHGSTIGADLGADGADGELARKLRAVGAGRSGAERSPTGEARHDEPRESCP